MIRIPGFLLNNQGTWHGSERLRIMGYLPNDPNMNWLAPDFWKHQQYDPSYTPPLDVKIRCAPPAACEREGDWSTKKFWEQHKSSVVVTMLWSMTFMSEAWVSLSHDLEPMVQWGKVIRLLRPLLKIFALLRPRSLVLNVFLEPSTSSFPFIRRFGRHKVRRWMDDWRFKSKVIDSSTLSSSIAGCWRDLSCGPIYRGSAEPMPWPHIAHMPWEGPNVSSRSCGSVGFCFRRLPFQMIWQCLADLLKRIPSLKLK